MAVSRISLALDPAHTGGVGGIGGAAHVTAGWGRASDDGLARLDFRSARSGQIGVPQADSKGGTNTGTDNDFHVAGMGRYILGGITRSTMEVVPGRTPTYIDTVAGTRIAPWIGRGP